MALVDTKLVRPLGGGINADGNSTASLLWHVITDSLEDDQYKVTVLNPDLPQLASEYDFYGRRKPGLHLKSYKPNLRTPDESRFIWDVILEYSTEPASTDTKPDEQTGDPLDMTPKISIYCVKERKPILRDLNDALIASSAGEPYDPVQEIDRTRTMVRIVRNVLDCNPVANQEYADTLNEFGWSGFPAQTVKCETPGSVEVLYTSEGQRYYQETWEFSLPVPGVDIANKWETRQLKLLDYGMYKIVAGERENLKDNAGKELVSAAPLDGAGGVLDPGDPPVFLPVFEVYKLKDFYSTGLPDKI